MLDLTLTPADRAEVQIIKAFRLGVKRSEGPPRKILVEMKSGRDYLKRLELSPNLEMTGDLIT